MTYSHRALVFSLLALLVISIDAYAELVEHLQQPLQMELQVRPNEVVTVVASQVRSDVSLELTGNDGETRIAVDIPANTGLDEWLTLHNLSCQPCQLTMTATEPIDRLSPVHLSITKHESIDIAVLQALKQDTEAAQKWYAAREDKNVLGELIEQYEDTKLEASSNSSYINIAFRQQLLHSEALHQLNEWSAVKDRLDIAEKFYANPNQKAGALAYIGRGEVLEEFSQEQEYYAKGLQLARDSKNYSLQIRALNNMGVSLIHNGQIEEGLTKFERAYEIAASNQHYRGLLRALYNQAWAYREASDHAAAIASTHELMQVAEFFVDIETKRWALYNLGRAYSSLGERGEAERYLRDALSSSPSRAKAALSSATLLNGYIKQELAEIALEYGDTTLATDHIESAKSLYESQASELDVSNATYLEGDIALAERRYSDAAKSYTYSLKYEEATGKTHYASQTHLKLAELYMEQKSWLRAANHQVKALNGFAKGDDLKRTGRALSQSAELLFELGHVEKAQKVLNSAEPLVMQYANDHHRILLTSRQARVLVEQSRFDEAIAMIELAKSNIDQQLVKTRRRDLQQTYLALQKELYELHIELLVNQNSFEEALYVAESFYARTLLARALMSRSAENTVDEEKRRKIHEQIEENARRFYELGKADPISYLKEARRLSAKLERVESASQLDNTHLKPQPALSKRPNVEHGTLMAFYFLGSYKSSLWLISAGEIQYVSLPPAQEIALLVNKALRHISTAPQLRTGSAWERRNSIQALSSAVFDPMVTHLEGNDITDLVIIADGALHWVPFSMLRFPSDQQPVIKKVNVSYSPSLRMSEVLNQRILSAPIVEPPTALVMADPVAASADKAISLTPGMSASLGRLPHSSKEADSLVNYLGEQQVSTLLAEQATKTHLLAEIKNNHTIAHFATHGLVNTTTPALSGLVLSPENDQQGLLMSEEIASLEFNHTQLVVLSACQTMLGRYVAGEGMNGLVRAFIDAGASQVIGSLWSVQDDATAALLDGFYKSLLADRLSTAEALRQAQLSVYTNKYNKWSDPYYWSGFVLQGSRESPFGRTVVERQ